MSALGAEAAAFEQGCSALAGPNIFLFPPAVQRLELINVGGVKLRVHGIRVIRAAVRPDRIFKPPARDVSGESAGFVRQDAFPCPCIAAKQLGYSEKAHDVVLSYKWGVERIYIWFPYARAPLLARDSTSASENRIKRWVMRAGCKIPFLA